MYFDTIYYRHEQVYTYNLAKYTIWPVRAEVLSSTQKYSASSLPVRSLTVLLVSTGIFIERISSPGVRIRGQLTSSAMFICFSLWLSLNLIKNHIVHSPEENQHDLFVKSCGIQAQFKQKVSFFKACSMCQALLKVFHMLYPIKSLQNP